MSRLPIRLRLTLVFALAMAIILAGVGWLLYMRLADSLDEQVAERLDARAAALAELVGRDDVPQPLPGTDEDFAQLIGPDGSVVAASVGLEAEPPLSPESAEDARVMVRELESGSRLVVGTTNEDRDEALAGLLAQLLLGGPIALAFASALGYLLAGAALRPVEEMRTRAGAISADTSGSRLPLPEARDEIRRLGETLNAMLGRLDDGLRRERRFVADAGHELRTPLALLRTELELALRRPRPQTELEDALRSAAEEVDRLARLAEDLLALAAVEDGRMQLRESAFSASDLLDSVARRFESRMTAAGRTLDVRAEADTVLRGDRVRLEQALGNLVDNALLHGAGTIRLEAAAADGSVALRVSDEGEGFPPEFVSRAFERFSRADEARGRGGAGLGLAIVAAVARAHGGDVRTATDAEAGALVEITLPPSGPPRESPPSRR